MRPIKTILLFLAFSSLIEARSQYFPDSLVATGVQTLPSVSQGYMFFLRYYRDSITYDSTTSIGDYHTVRKRTVYPNGTSDTSFFVLRVNNNRIFLTGTVHYAGKDIALNNLMILDYNHNVGDTFIVRINSDTSLDYHFKVDSVQMAMYQDGVKRITYYYTLRQGNHTFNRPVFSAQGLGSSLGLVYLRTDDDPLMEDQLISYCTPSKLIYGNKDCNILKNPAYHITPYCEEDSVIAGIARALKANVKSIDVASAIRVYPNPASDKFNVYTPLGCRVSLIDHTGRVCMDILFQEAGEHTVNTADLGSGVYIIAVRTGESMAYKKLSIVK